VQARLNHLLEPVGLFPERYRFKEPPPPGFAGKPASRHKNADKNF